MNSDKRLTQVKKFYKKYKRFPSYSEMANLFALKSKDSVFHQVKKWVSKGYLLKNDKKITPTTRFFSLPMLGTIKAGKPYSEEEQILEYSANELNFMLDPDRTFLLRVSGDSMINAGIFDQDLVVLEKTNEAKNGDIIAAFIDNEWTLKYFYKNEGKVVLIAGNSKYGPIYPKESLIVGGVVIKIIRDLNKN